MFEVYDIFAKDKMNLKHNKIYCIISIDITMFYNKYLNILKKLDTVDRIPLIYLCKLIFDYDVNEYKNVISYLLTNEKIQYNEYTTYINEVSKMLESLYYYITLELELKYKVELINDELFMCKKHIKDIDVINFNNGELMISLNLVNS